MFGHSTRGIQRLLIALLSPSQSAQRRPSPGKQVTLRPLAPLRTVRESFPSHRSSPSKATIRNPPSRNRRFNFALLTGSQHLTWRTHQWKPPSFAFPPEVGSTEVHATRHPSDVGSLSCRVTFKPVSAPLQHGIRFFRHPKPAPP